MEPQNALEQLGSKLGTKMQRISQGLRCNDESSDLQRTSDVCVENELSMT